MDTGRSPMPDLANKDVSRAPIRASDVGMPHDSVAVGHYISCWDVAVLFQYFPGSFGDVRICFGVPAAALVANHDQLVEAGIQTRYTHREPTCTSLLLFAIVMSLLHSSKGWLM